MSLSLRICLGEPIFSKYVQVKNTFGLPIPFFQSCQATLIGRTLQVLGPPYVGLLSKAHQVVLERVQSFAARVVTHKWQKDAKPLKILLKWPPLSCRKRVQKPCVCKRILSGSSFIPASSFTCAYTISKSHLNLQPLFRPFVRTSHHKASFFVDIINKWNSVPEKITSLLSNNAYKLQLKKFYY